MQQIKIDYRHPMYALKVTPDNARETVDFALQHGGWRQVMKIRSLIRITERLYEKTGCWIIAQNGELELISNHMFEQTFKRLDEAPDNQANFKK